MKHFLSRASQYLLFLLTIVCANFHTTIFAQNDTVGFNTGFDYQSKSLQSVGQPCSNWKIISDPDSTTTEPRSATVCSTHAGWAAPKTNSLWISTSISGGQNINGPYVFETTFALRNSEDNEDTMRTLKMDVYADDRAYVYLNDSLIGTTPSIYAFRDPVTYIVCQKQKYFKQGENKLRIDVLNNYGVAMGLDVAGSVITSDTLVITVHDNWQENNADFLLGDAYPNPAYEKITIPFILPRNEKNVSLGVVNALGQNVASFIHGEEMKEGSYRKECTLSHLLSGMYFSVLRTEAGSKAKSLIIVR